LEALQRRQLGELVAHFQTHLPHFQGRLRDAGLSHTDLTVEGGLQQLPVLTRRAVQSAGNLFCDVLPPGHGPTYENRTSGSTGEPVLVRRTAVNAMDWMATTMRDHLWHQRDFGQRLCMIRATVDAVALCKDWGPPVSWLFKTGPLLAIPTATDVSRQIDLIREFAPQVLLLYPNNLAAMMRDAGELPSVRHILAVGESLSSDLREAAHRQWNASVVDLYSSAELGTIALQCPVSGLYHIMAENLILEVLKPDGSACAVGEMGRVVATDLRNYAMPLIRYDIGDFAEVGPACRCGRGLPTLSRVLGRERNLVLMPDGTRNWPYLGAVNFREIAPILQFQFIQDGRESIELRLVVKRPLSLVEENELIAQVQTMLGFAFQVRLNYFAERIPLGPNGKFEEFVCRV
jgi:phenylacetate-CoA ligase